MYTLYYRITGKLCQETIQPSAEPKPVGGMAATVQFAPDFCLKPHFSVHLPVAREAKMSLLRPEKADI